MQVVGEGESGQYYELAPGPWGDFHPFGRIGRQHYDTYCTNGIRIAQNCLKHTAHEPMTRIFVVEQEFAKKYNIPDDQYQAYYGKPKEPRVYSHVRFVLTPEGRVTQSQPNWLSYQYRLGVCDNPRLMADSRRNRSFLAVGSGSSDAGTYATGTFAEPPIGGITPPSAE
jgi:hypothetical protein